MKLLHETHEDVEFIDCFSSIGLQYQFFPVKIKTRPCIGILKRKDNVPLQWIMDQPTMNINDVESSYDDDVESNEIEDLNESMLLEPPTQIEEDIDILKELSSRIDQENPNELPTSFGAFDNLPESTKPSTKSKLKRLIESHFRSKGSVIESDKELDRETSDELDKESDNDSNVSPSITISHTSAKANIKRIIKSEQIKELVESISKLDLNVVCDLEHLSTKECLKKIIDDYDVKID